MANAKAQIIELPEIPERESERNLHPSATILNVGRTRYSRHGKRIVDIVLSGVGLVVLAPLFIGLALAVRIRLGRGGVIFRQQRVGENGVPFTIYKFRSMLPDRRVSNAPYVGVERRKVHKSDNDPRHTPFGRMLRASSLDELPQLLNVLKGDMSLVGPRPELVEVAEREGFVAHPRHLTRPGITGTFQVSDLRSKSRIAAGLHLDVAYVADIRLAADLKIMARTVVVLAPGSWS